MRFLEITVKFFTLNHSLIVSTASVLKDKCCCCIGRSDQSIGDKKDDLFCLRLCLNNEKQTGFILVRQIVKKSRSFQIPFVGFDYLMLEEHDYC